MNKTEKEALRFSQRGYLTIFKGDTYPHKDWFKENGARYTRLWGWAFAEDVPEDIPEGITPIRLDWEMIGNEDGSLKNEDVVKAMVESLVYDPDPSEFVGEEGDKVEIDVVIERAIPMEGYYGRQTMHLMRGADNNLYVWITAAKDWPEGSTHSIRGTVKTHRTYRGAKQTVLTRCSERKEKK